MLKSSKRRVKKVLSLFLLCGILVSPLSLGFSTFSHAEKQVENSKEEKLNSTTLKIVDENGNLVKQPIKFRVIDSWDYMYYKQDPNSVNKVDLVSSDALLDLKPVTETDLKDAFCQILVLDQPNSKILNLKENSGTIDQVVFHLNKDKSDGSMVVKRFLKDNSSETIDSLKISGLKFDESISNSEISDVKKDEKYVNEYKNYGKEVTVPDIEVVYEDGKKVEDNVHFHTFDKDSSSTSIHDYYVKNGKLTGVKAPIGHRMKLGIPKPQNETHTLTDSTKATFNYIWFKVDDDGKAIRFDDKDNKIIGNLDKVTVLDKKTLIGTKPQGERVKKEIDIFDITSNVLVNKDSVKFSVTGDGEVREVKSENGKISIDLYKNVKYSISLIRSMENPFKMDGFKFILGDDGQLKYENGEEFTKLKVYQGTYTVRIYVLHGNKFVKDVDFQIIEDGSKKIQEKVSGTQFVTFETEIGKSYTIKLKDNDTYTMEPVHITMKVYPKDGLYWPMLDQDKVPKGDDGKLKAFQLKRKDGIGNDENTLNPNSPCPKSDCVISKHKVKTLPISVKSRDNSDVDGLEFKLFNSSKQRFEGVYRVKDGKLPELELMSQNNYFLQLVDKNYSAKNVYITANEDGQLPYNFKTNSVQSEIIVDKKVVASETNTKHSMTLRVVYNEKVVDNVKLKFISEFENFEVTSKDGQVTVDLFEDVTYVVKPVDENYKVDVFPLVVKDKSEYGEGYGKYTYDHSSCNGVTTIFLKDNDKKLNNSSVTCTSGHTTIYGMNFNDLQLVMDRLDKENFETLKNRDVDVIDVVLINPHRCERTKIAYGDFRIKRELTNDKTVERVYYFNNGVEEELNFTQNGKMLDIEGVKDLGIKQLVIQYKDKSAKVDEIKAIEIVFGARQEIKKGERFKTVKLDADFENFRSITVDGKELSKELYTVRKGSTIVDFKNEFTEILGYGEHKIVFEFTDGRAETTFVILNDEKDDNLKDNSSKVDNSKVNNQNSITDNKVVTTQKLPRTNIAFSDFMILTPIISLGMAFVGLKKYKK